ncbi:MAG: capsular biosynthesis protein, partial [Pseudomonadota bacterium]
MTARILMLQGPASWFPTHLGRALTARGAEVTRICLCPGDRLFWRGGARVLDYRGRPEHWADWLAARVAVWGITDLICLGDGRHWHRAAIDRLGPRGVRIHLIEQGYLRPHFLTVERDGTGGNTRFPKDWRQIEDLARREAVPVANYRSSFARFATMDVAYNLANLFAGWLTHPHYRTHALDGPLIEWAGWVGKAAIWPLRRTRSRRAQQRIAAHRGALFLMALQLETDYQIRLHAPEGGVQAALARTMRSFATHAPERAMLVIKPHPLDNGWAGWRAQVRELARILGLCDRVVFLEGGALEPLFRTLSGLVTINSTTGLSALRAGCPVKSLGKAIYDLPGLTHRGSLDSFWRA